MRVRRDNEPRVLDAIRARGTRNFTGAEIADEAGLCRQTVYKIITSSMPRATGSRELVALASWPGSGKTTSRRLARNSPRFPKCSTKLSIPAAADTSTVSDGCQQATEAHRRARR